MDLACRIEISNEIQGSFDMIYGAKNYLVQEYQTMNKMFQVNYAELERKAMSFYFRRTKMIKLSTGVEISEDTVISALKKAGINVEPKHIFKAGDVAYAGQESPANWRLISLINHKLYGINQNGILQGSLTVGGQDHFDAFDYKYVGRQSDLLKG